MKQDLTFVNAKNAVIEYINNLIGIYSSFFNDNYHFINNRLVDIYNSLFNLQASVMNCYDLDTLSQLNSSIKDVEEILKDGVRIEKLSKLSSRELSLMQRGYSEEEVLELCYCSEKQASDISKIIFDRISHGCESVDDPICIFLGGQPGCGKTTASGEIKKNFDKSGIVEIGIDNYRTYHPNYLRMEQIIKKHWEGKASTNNDSPGNDIADFTHAFAGNMTNLLEDMASKRKYNISMEWAMRDPKEPLETMKKLKDMGYKNIVNYIMVHRDVSLSACVLRANIMNSNNHIIRRIPESFHNFACDTLPNACKEIYEKGYVIGHFIDAFHLLDRNNQVIWDHSQGTKPEDVFKEWLNNPEHSMEFINHSEYANTAYENEAHGFGAK